MANIIKNPSFEWVGDWTCTPPNRVYITSNGGREGRGGLCFDNYSVGGMVQVGQKVKLAGGKTYKVYYWAKLRGRFDTWGAYEYYTPAGQQVFVNRPSLEGQLKSEQWVRLSFDVQLGDVRNNDVWIYIRGGGTYGDGASWLYIDDVSLDTGVAPSGYINYSGAKATAAVTCFESTQSGATQWGTFSKGATLDARDSEDPLYPSTKWIMTKYGTTWGYSERKYIDVSYSSNTDIHQMFGDDVLKIGSTGVHVAHLQHFLNRYLASGYQLTVDGVFGAKNSKTHAAVIEFQKSQGLTHDGEVGDVTKQALMDYAH